MTQVHPQASVHDGSVIGWRDITSNIIVRGTGPTDPTWDQIGSGPFYAYNFAVNDQAWFAYHIPHDVVPVGDEHNLTETIQFFFHSHWLSDGTDTNTVKWEFVYTHANGFNQQAFDMATGTTTTAEEAASGTAYQHMVTESAGQNISTITEPDGILYVRVRRVTNGGTENTDNIYLLTSDIHYLSNSLHTRSKSPGFYVDHD